MEKRSLRILYTINAGHYILARSLIPIEVTIIPNDAGPAQFGSVSLKRCLNTVCQSSPEIFQDLAENSTRDFSVYLLDPMEADTAPEQVNIADTAQPSSRGRGVAVGMGLMSWGLESEESEAAAVNGTLTKPNGAVALEVVLALRETVRMSKSSLPGSTRHAETAANIAAAKSRQKSRQAEAAAALSRKTPKPPKPLPESEADRILLASDSYSYIGPPKRRKGKPQKASASRARKTAGSTAPVADVAFPPSQYSSFFSRSVSLPSTSSTETTWQISQPTLCASAPSPTSTSSPSVPHASTSTSRAASAEASSSTSAAPSPEYHHIDRTAVLSFLSAGSNPNSALLSAITSIDVTGGSPALVHALQMLLATMPEQTNSQHAPQSSPPKDKENLNPTVRPRPAAMKPVSSSQSASSSPQRVGLGVGVNSTSPTSRPPATENTAGQLARKRTLSDFMGDSSHRQEPSTSPVRGPSSHNGSSRGRPICIPDSPLAPRVSASSPVKPPPAKTKKYVLPSWARTETALQPRLSEEAQLARQALEEQKQANKEKKLRERKPRLHKPSNTAPTELVEPTTPTAPSPVAAPSSPPRPSAVSSVVSACSNHASSSIFSTPKRAVRVSILSPGPCTPPRKRNSPSSSTPLSSSLFTPLGWDTPLGAGGISDAIFSPLAGRTITIRKPDVEDGKLAEANDFQSSLPIASDDEDAGSQDTVVSNDTDTTMGTTEPKEFWHGLPPSSPMASSSPLLGELGLPDMDEETDEIPVATSETEFDSDVEATRTDVDMEVEAEEKVQFDETPTSDMDVFDMFTNLNNLGSDDFASSETGHLGDMDLSEFWESVKPLITPEGATDFGELGSLDGLLGQSIDTAQFADQVQSLFSGCLM